MTSTVARTPDLSLVDLLETSVQKYGSRPLFITRSKERGWTETSYDRFARLVDNLRAGLAWLGVARGDRVGIIANNSIEWAVVAYATYGLGAALVPMYQSQRVREWAFIAADSGVKVLFTGTSAIQREAQKFQGSIPTLLEVLPLFGDDPVRSYPFLLAAGGRRPLAPVHPLPEETACLLYTSGTTGEPKGVVLSHGNVVSNVVSLGDSIPTADDDRTLSLLPWAHSFGHTVELHGAIRAGAAIALAQSIDTVLDDLKEVRPTVLVAVPRVFLQMHAAIERRMDSASSAIRWLFYRGLAAAKAKARGETLGVAEEAIRLVADRVVFARVRAGLGGRLRYAVCGGAALPREVAEFIDALGIAVYEGYGLTETSPIVAANIPGQRKLTSAGRPIPGVRVVIDRSATSDTRQGEIVVYGPNVMQGYHNRQQENGAIFTPDGGLRTGDIGYLDEDNFLFVTGRIKEQYKLANGKYVAPGPLEEQLKLSPIISSVMIFGENKPYNVALLVLDEARLRDWAARQGLTGRTVAELADQPPVRLKIGLEIDRLSSEFKKYERVKAFAVIAEDFTTENDMLTPSLKLKRRNVVRRWSSELDSLYLHGDGSRAGRPAGPR